MTDREQPRGLPPLDGEEAWALALASLLSQAIALVCGIVGAVLLTGATTGDWFAATMGFGWACGIADSLTALPPLPTVAAGVAAAALLWVGAWLNERRALANDEGRAAVFETRRGLNGELPRLPFPALVILMAITGFVEELLYRYAIIGLASLLLGFVLPGGIATVIALVASSIAFWLSHGHYRNAGHAVIVTVIGLALGAVYLISGSLAVAAIAHALYDLAVLAAARMQMRRDPGYFGGPAPNRLIIDSEDDE